MTDKSPPLPHPLPASGGSYILDDKGRLTRAPLPPAAGTPKPEVKEA